MTAGRTTERETGRLPVRMAAAAMSRVPRTNQAAWRSKPARQGRTWARCTGPWGNRHRAAAGRRGRANVAPLPPPGRPGTRWGLEACGLPLPQAFHPRDSRGPARWTRKRESRSGRPSRCRAGPRCPPCCRWACIPWAGRGGGRTTLRQWVVCPRSPPPGLPRPATRRQVSVDGAPAAGAGRRGAGRPGGCGAARR
jgi:hypothetical protein